MPGTSWGWALARIVAEDPDKLAVLAEDGSATRRELESQANRLARALAERGVREGDFVTIALPNGLAFVRACLAVWKLGAVPNPVSASLPLAERAAIIERAAPRLVLGVPAADPAAGGRATLPPDFEPEPALSDAPLPERVSPHERALASSGSTGAPKLIVAAHPALYDPERASPLFAARGAVLVPGPLHHAAPWSACFQGLFAGASVVVMTRFDAARCLALVEAHRVERMLLVPTMLLRIYRLPREERLARDLSSLRFVLTGGAPCPSWLMRAFIDWLGASVMHEAYGPSERIGGTFITGREWLEHPGSVGRPTQGTEIRILDPETGRELPPGETGEIYFMPPGGPGSTYRYVGAQPRVAEGGWESVGDMGRLDRDGYLYLADRRSDMILCGGHNVVPAEVEAALEAHPALRSAAVIGLPDEDLGSRIHAIVETAAPVSDAELLRHLATRLVRWKLPKSFERVEEPLRDDAGKSRRHALRAARIDASGAVGHGTS